MAGAVWAGAGAGAAMAGAAAVGAAAAGLAGALGTGEGPGEGAAAEEPPLVDGSAAMIPAARSAAVWEPTRLAVVVPGRLAEACGGVAP